MFRTMLALGLAMGFASAAVAEEEIWNIKAVAPDGQTLAIKALPADGRVLDIKARGAGEQSQILAIGALSDGAWLPVKVLDLGGDYLSVKAIASDGTLVDVKALARDGYRLDVKGVGQDGAIIHIKAMDGDLIYGVKALHPNGRVYDVKGIRFAGDGEEGEVNQVGFHAHVKALPPA